MPERLKAYRHATIRLISQLKQKVSLGKRQLIIETYNLKNLKKEILEMLHGWVGAIVFALQYNKSMDHMLGSFMRVRTADKVRRETTMRQHVRSTEEEISSINMKFFLRELIIAYKDLLLYMQAIFFT